jgi:hypothetical protein
MDNQTAKLTEKKEIQDLEARYKRIYGAVAFPGKRPGFAVVAGMINEEHFESNDIYLIDEFESIDMRELIRQCGVLDFKYKPEVWVGDRLNSASDFFIKEMNEDFKSSRRTFSLSLTPILNMKKPYEFICPQLKHLLNEDRRQLFLLEDSKVVGELSVINPSQITELEFGEHPAIEALAFAVFELRNRGDGMTVEEARESWARHRRYY